MSSGSPVDLLALTLADLAEQHRVRRGVDPEAPRIAQAVRHDLGAYAGNGDERVAGRDRVGQPVLRVDAENRAEEIVEVWP